MERYSKEWQEMQFEKTGLLPPRNEAEEKAEIEWEIWMTHHWPEHFHYCASFEWSRKVAYFACKGILSEKQIEKTAKIAGEKVWRKIKAHKCDWNHPLVKFKDFMLYVVKCVEVASDEVLLGLV